ncbi:hypothetical protein GCM10025868_01350 [Angustibacter aerolatus]|uniref:Uncharacterized protein n=1 Tax=Angustibacter aerolatus TaxID=1162965 RepID=A0ABQ6J9M6_9ACTN|nr:hypothetical protein GCM10025868_01350 [Angustibacter aerolatus]
MTGAQPLPGTPQEVRVTSRTGSTVRRRSRRSGASMRENSRSAANRPISAPSWSITVTAGLSDAAIGKSPKPITPMSLRRSASSAGTSAIVQRAFDENSAVGGSGPSSIRRSAVVNEGVSISPRCTRSSRTGSPACASACR